MKNTKSNIPKKTKILVAVSGGADSVFLLNLLNLVKDEFNLEIFVVHVNHQLRGRESDDDAKFVEKFCENLCVKCIVKKIKFRGKTGIEEKARDKRYEIFEDICKEHDIKYCALAHNADDNVETILMWLIRGAGLDGAEGIPQTRFLDDEKKILLVRPILSFYKKEILDFLSKNKIPFRFDSSNKSNLFFRNKLRNELIPILEKYNSRFKEHVLNFSEIIAENNVFVEEMLEPYLDGMILKFSDENIVIDLENFIKYNVAVQKKLLAYILKNKANSVHIKSLYDLLKNNKNFKLDLKTGFVAVKEYERLTIKKVKELDNKIDLEKICSNFTMSLRGVITTRQSKISMRLPHYESRLFVRNDNTGYEIKIKIFDIKDKLEIKDIKDPNCAFLDYDLLKKIVKNINFRTRKSGDIFKPFSMRKYKKLKDFFIDEKVPYDERTNMILLTNGIEILWVPGYRICEDFKVSDKTRRVLKMKIR